jgi:hypothetical protein
MLSSSSVMIVSHHLGREGTASCTSAARAASARSRACTSSASELERSASSSGHSRPSRRSFSGRLAASQASRGALSGTSTVLQYVLDGRGRVSALRPSVQLVVRPCRLEQRPPSTYTWKPRATGRDGDRDRVPSLPREVRQSRRNARDRVGDQSASGLGNCVTTDREKCNETDQ